eukprot:Hpha_TRINITY_DN13149_c0_g2::TRINITY_DN13149_c0_g2_i1::g.113324::m.113324
MNSFLGPRAYACISDYREPLSEAARRGVQDPSELSRASYERQVTEPTIADRRAARDPSEWCGVSRTSTRRQETPEAIADRRAELIHRAALGYTTDKATIWQQLGSVEGQAGWEELLAAYRELYQADLRGFLSNELTSSELNHAHASLSAAGASWGGEGLPPLDAASPGNLTRSAISPQGRAHIQGPIFIRR